MFGLNLKQYEKVYNLKSKKIKEIKTQSIKVANNNDQYDDNLKERNVILHDRRHISEEISKGIFCYCILINISNLKSESNVKISW